MKELNGVEQEVLDALESRPHSMETLIDVLGGPSPHQVRDAVNVLKVQHLVAESHVLTNPPKTLYRRTIN